jgi:tRNA pseudouridine38-40 synthase
MTQLRRVALRLSYDGTDFAGWQRQREGERSVQGVVEEALTELLGESVALAGAGRTDAGVHALDQCAHFETRSAFPVEAFVPALAGKLPRDIAVWRAQEVPADFHARYSAKMRSYQYLMVLADKLLPPSCLSRHRVGHLRGRYDLDRMAAAATLFLGEHDFRFFRSSQCQADNPVRTVDEIAFRPLSPEATAALGVLPGQIAAEMRVSARAFLMRQVRCMAGGLAMLGRGKLTEDDLRALLRGEPREAAKSGVIPAPAEGLTLSRVDYGPDAPI